MDSKENKFLPEFPTLRRGVRIFLNKFYPVSLTFLIFISLYALFYFFFGEIVPVNNGLGWDGTNYGQMAKDFYNYIFVQHIEYYFAQRILPSGVIHLFLRIFHFPLEDFYVIKGFQIYNSLLLLFSAVLWQKICSRLVLSRSLQWLAFTCLFINFAILKQSFYYSVLTDVTAFFLGVLMLYFYLTDNSWGVLGATLAGAFTWPISLVYAFFLFVIPKHVSINTSMKNTFNPVFSTAMALSVVGVFLMLTIIPCIQHTFHNFPDFQFAPMMDSLIGLSISAVAVYLFFGSKQTFENCGWPGSAVLKKTVLYRFIIFFLLVCVIYKIVHSIGYDNPQNRSLVLWIKTFVYCACVKPFIFVVANVVYFGPIVLCAIFLWGPLIRTVSNYGKGMSILFFLILVFSIDPDARHQMFVFPFLVAFTIKTMERYPLPKPFYITMFILSLIFSKIFLIMNKPPFTGSYLEFPYQYYFMNHGPWMSGLTYGYQGGVIIVTAIVLYQFLYKKRVHGK